MIISRPTRKNASILLLKRLDGALQSEESIFRIKSPLFRSFLVQSAMAYYRISTNDHVNEQLRKQALNAERDIWKAYVKKYPQFKKHGGYLVLLETEFENIDPERITSLKQLERLHPVVIETKLKQDQADFKYWLSDEHALDWLALSVANPRKPLDKHFLHTLGTDTYRATVNLKRGRVTETDIRLRTMSNIEQQHESGVIFFFNLAQEARELQGSVDEAEQFRQLMGAHLPEFTLSATFPKLPGNRIFKSDQVIPVRITSPYHISEGSMSIHQLVYMKFVSYLQNCQSPAKGTTQKSTFGARLKLAFKDKRDLQQVTISYLSVPLVPETIIRQAEQRLIDRSYELAIQHGDFKLPDRDGIEHRVERLRLVNTCEAIERLFLSPLGEATSRNTYNTDRYSGTTLKLFIRGIYQQDIRKELTFEVLPELYGLFFELGCRYEPLGLTMNVYLANQVRDIDAYDDLGKTELFKSTVKLVKSFVKQMHRVPELVTFNRQLDLILMELQQGYALDEMDYRDIVMKLLVPKFRREYHQDPRQRKEGKIWPITVRIGEEDLNDYMHEHHIGLYSSDIEAEDQDAVFDGIGKVFETVMREQWTGYPISWTRIIIDDLEYKYAIYPVKSESQASENDSDEDNSDSGQDDSDEDSSSAELDDDL